MLNRLDSGVTEVGVTRVGNWWRHLFFLKKLKRLF